MENNKFLRKQIEDLEKEVKKLKAELAETKLVISGKTFSYPMDYYDLKAKVAVAIEALEGIQKESCAWLMGPDKIEYKQFHDFYARMARAALEKLK